MDPRFSSGLDDSPLWDEGVPVESPELNTYLVMQIDALAKMAEILGLDDDAQTWRAQAESLAEKIIEHFWDDPAGVFWAMHHHKPVRVLCPCQISHREHREIRILFPVFPLPSVAKVKCDIAKVLTPFNLYPLLTGRISRAIVERLVAPLTNPTEFWSEFPISTVVLNDPKFDANHIGWSSAVFIDLAIGALPGEKI